jgi:predicted ATPase
VNATTRCDGPQSSGACAVAEIRDLVVRARIVTLVGTGGIGKTRAALEVASALVDRFRDGVWFAELAVLTDPALVAGTVAFALGVAQQAGRPVLDTLHDRLRDKELLLVLDNCEHVIDETARVVESMLRECRGMKILATSREVLRVGGERVYRVPPLDLPRAVDLFAECAASADPSFELTERNLSSVTEICRRLDGIPLALELAAARTPALAPERLVSELDERFRILAGGARTAVPRQQTMRALMDWSYDLLTPQEQRLLRELAIFAGGWTLPAATAVGSGEVLQTLGSLIDKSLVVVQANGDDRRYALLETTRAYALEKLDASGEREAVARRHAEWVAAHAAAVQALPKYRERMSALRVDIENIRSAVAWSLANDATLPIAASILNDARAFLAQNLREELLVQTRALLERDANLTREVTAQLLIQLALITIGSEALAAAAHAVALLQEGEAKSPALVRAYQRKSYALAQLQRLPEAIEANRSAVVLHQELGLSDSMSLGTLYFSGGYLLSYEGKFAEARDSFARSAALFRECGDTVRAARALGNVADCHFLEDDADRAILVAQESLALCRQEDVPYLEALTLSNLAMYRLRNDDLRGAARDLLAAVETARKAGDEGLLLSRAIRHAALLGALQGEHETAAILLGYSAAWFAARDFHDPSDEHEFHRLRILLQERFGEDGLARFSSDGAQLEERGAWDLAAAVVSRAAS